MTAQTTHFSSGFLVLLDKPGTAKDLSEYFTNYITGRSGVKQPGCGDERSPRDAGVKVTSDRGDRVLWCFGQEDGRRVLKVSNNTRTFAEVTYPSRWKVLDAFSVSLDTDTIARYFGSKARQPSGRSSRIVDGGDTLTLALPDRDPGGSVQVSMSIIAWAVGGIVFAVETLVAVDDAARGALSGAARGKLRLVLCAADPLPTSS